MLKCHILVLPIKRKSQTEKGFTGCKAKREMESLQLKEQNIVFIKFQLFLVLLKAHKNGIMLPNL